jgi:hypothetical protein
MAADTNFNNSYALSRVSNVLGAVEVLRFASSSYPCKHLHHVSTLSVFGRLARRDTLLREDMTLGRSAAQAPVLGADGYSASKWVAEQLMLRARARGLPVSICRMGFISWAHPPRLANTTTTTTTPSSSSTTSKGTLSASSSASASTSSSAAAPVAAVCGQSNAEDWLTRLLRAVLYMGEYPITQLTDTLDLCAVDYVAACFVRVCLTLEQWRAESSSSSAAASSLSSELLTPTYHIASAHSRALPFMQLMSWLQSFGFHSLRAVPYSDFLKRVQTDASNPLFSLVPYFENGFPSGGRFDDATLRRLLHITPTPTSASASSAAPALSAPALKPLHTLPPAPEVSESRAHEHVRWMVQSGLAKTQRLALPSVARAQKRWGLAKSTLHAAYAFLNK